MFIQNKNMKNLGGNNNFYELRKRLLFLLFSMIIFRLGVYIPIPFINKDALNQLMFFHNYTTSNTLLNMFNMFSGGALEKLSIFALGLMPYISSSIIIQMMSSISSKLIEIKKEGERGQKKITQYTRYLTFILSLIQSYGITVFYFHQKGLVVNTTLISFYCFSILSMTTGSIFLMWLGEQISEKGVGNGISLIIFSGIVSNLPFQIKTTILQAHEGIISYFSLWALLIILLSVITFVVFMERSQRRIIVNYAKRQQGRKMMIPQRSHLPLKINMAGVMPPIFASSLLMMPGMLSNWFGSYHSLIWLNNINNLLQPGTFIYTLLFSSAILFFCFFYTNLMFNPKEMAENLKKTGAFITGIRPGEQTAKYINSVMNKLTLIGAIYINIICLLPIFIIHLFSYKLSFTFGGTSLWIVVVVIMDFIAKIQSYFLSKQYDSLLNK